LCAAAHMIAEFNIRGLSVVDETGCLVRHLR